MKRLFEETWRMRNAPTPRLVPFLTPDEYLAAALKAYIAARKGLEPPPGQLWLEPFEGRFMAWAGPEDFYNALHRELDERVRLLAIERGDLIRRYYSPEELAEFESDSLAIEAMADALIRRADSSGSVAAGGLS